MRYLTLSWDDGARRSTVRTAEIYEKHGLRAEFNAVAAWSLPGASGNSGDFALWNELQARGHVIQPHGYDHTNKSEAPLPVAQDLIRRCLGIFEDNLHGFDPKQAIYNFPYNATTPELEAWLPTVVRAFRTGHGPMVSPLPTPQTVKLVTTGFEAAEEGLESGLDALRAVEDGWFLYTVHGLDGEGWGPVRSSYLDRLLGALLERGDVEILPARAVLDRARA